MFCGAQPTVLNASVTAMPWLPELTALTSLASMFEVFCASTVTAPLSGLAAVPSVLFVTNASAPPRTVLVAIRPPTASEAPSPNLLPPEDETATFQLRQQ
jgi:hypothetical protein